MYPKGASNINPLAALKPSKLPRRHMLEEYLRREERSLERHSYFDGIIVPVPIAKGPHNIITANIIVALGNALQAADKDYTLDLWREKIHTDMNDRIVLRSVGCSIALADIYRKIPFKPY